MASRFRFESICAFCHQQGQRTVLSEQWMRVQTQLVLPGEWLACEDHLSEQQQHLQERDQRRALRNRSW